MKNAIFIFIVFIIVHCTFIIEDCICQWEPDVRLTTSPGNSKIQYGRCLKAVTTNVYVVWYDDRDGNTEIYFKKSTNNGLTWTAGTQLTNNSENSDCPSIAVSGSNIHVVWEDDRGTGGYTKIYYKHSTNESINWGVDTRLYGLVYPSSGFRYPAIAVLGSNIHVVSGDEILYVRSSNGGMNWSDTVNLSYEMTDFPSIAISPSNIHVAFQEWFNDPYNYDSEIAYTRSTNGGAIWNTPVRLTINNGDSQEPSLAVDGSNVHLAWMDSRDGNWEIYYKRSTDGGINWGTDKRLTTQTADSKHPSVTVSGLNVYLVWYDRRDGNNEIYYKNSTNNGATWSTDMRLTNNSASSEYPSISTSGSIIHVIWQDNRDGNYSVYYKRNPTGNIGIKNISSEVPEEFALEQNYPNPFNQSTMFNFQCSMAGIVQVKVFDIMGKEVTTLVNKYLKEGTYEVLFDAGNLPSGIYFYQLKANNFIETKKLIILK